MHPSVATHTFCTMIELRKHREVVAMPCKRLEQYGQFTSPPKVMTLKIRELQERVETCGRWLDIEIGWQPTGGACDGNKFAAAGLANIDTLGPRGGLIHSTQEYLLTDSLVPRAKLAASLLMNLALQ